MFPINVRRLGHMFVGEMTMANECTNEGILTKLSDDKTHMFSVAWHNQQRTGICEKVCFSIAMSALWLSDRNSLILLLSLYRSFWYTISSFTGISRFASRLQFKTEQICTKQTRVRTISALLCNRLESSMKRLICNEVVIPVELTGICEAAHQLSFNYRKCCATGFEPKSYNVDGCVNVCAEIGSVLSRWMREESLFPLFDCITRR